MFSLVLVLALRAAAAAERDEELASPVDKVLELMNSLLTQVKEEGAAEAADYKSFACFCKDTQLAKDTAIKDGNTAENDQLATIEQMTALEASTIQSISDLNTQLDNTEQALTDAGNLRAEQRAKYEKKHTDTVNSVTGVRSAISDITSSTSFVEKEAVVKSAKVVALLKAAAQDPGDASYMQSDPGGKSREHAGLGASSSITEILDMLLDDWSQKAKKLEDEETARKTLYDQQSAELRQMIIDTKGAIDSAEIQLSETKATNAQTKGQLTETKANLHDDTKYLKDLTAQCEAKATEWDQRSAMRAGEIKALTEAIDIVGGSVASTQGTRGYTDNSEPVLLQGGKPAQADRYTDVVFTQLKEVRKFSADQSSREKEMRLEAVTNIKHMAAKLNSVPLNLLAMKIAADPFAKVKELIQQLITRLLTESQNEATQKGWCDTEIGKANSDRDHRMEDTKSLSA
jgi:chromosome segregation ATPase